jgi:SAM-dependent methyltransferase
MQTAVTEKIEILSTDLLDQYRPLVNELRGLASSLRLEFGWHYLLDLCWVVSYLGTIDGKHFLDAGAGTGVLQWYLAENGAEVLSVDRTSRAVLPLKFRHRFHVQGLRQGDAIDLKPAFTALVNNLKATPNLRTGLRFLAYELLSVFRSPSARGRVFIYNQDLQNLEAIPSDSLDAVVALSALEHNPRQNLNPVVNELLRVVKPGGLLLATLGAAQDADWFHEPSQGWCYTEASLRQAFDLPKNTPSNYEKYVELFNRLRNSADLRDNLARFYYHSANNGMPWGVWDPKYQSVGVLKVKQS